MAPIAARRRSVVGSQATLALLQPHAAQKKPARLRFKSDRPSTQVGGVYKPAGRWPAGFWATFTRWIKTQTRVIFARRQIRNACNLPSRARIPMPSAALPSICGLQPAACCACGPRPQCPGHPQPPASVPGACGPRPQSQAFAALSLSLSPKHPQHPAHATHLGAAPSAQSQAPSVSMPPCASRPPFATHHTTLYMWFPTQLRAMQASSAQPQPTTPECLRLAARHGPVPAPLAPRAAVGSLPFRRDLFEQPGA